MSTTIKYKIALAVATMLAVVLMIVLPARAAPPANDDFYAATNITSLPFSEGINTSEATSTPDDPYPTCNYPPNHTREATVWYQFIPPETQFVTAIAASNDYNNVLAVYTGAPGSFQQIACDILGHPVTLQAESGNTYYFMVAAMEPSPYPDPSGGGYGGWLNFSLSAAPPLTMNCGCSISATSLMTPPVPGADSRLLPGISVMGLPARIGIRPINTQRMVAIS
jgi:hypothetical protein